MAYEYCDGILRELARHGVCPHSRTSPDLIRSYLNVLYRYEIRRLRDALLRGDFQGREYAGRIAVLRDRYWLLSFPIKRWVKKSETRPRTHSRPHLFPRGRPTAAGGRRTSTGIRTLGVHLWSRS